VTDLHAETKLITETFAEKAMRECTELRYSLGENSVDESPHALHEKLIRARKALDRTEEHVARLARMYGNLLIAAEQRRDKVEDEEAQVIDNLPAAQEFATARGLDSSRRDLDTRIRLITLQTSLEK
jgi:DNA-directed RNA polymerase beta' subunit